MTDTLPVGGAPVFFTLVVGTNATDAAKVLHVLRKDISPGAHWTSAKENSAWTLTSITGAVTTAARTTFVACLTQGKPPSGVAPSPARYVLSTVAACLDALSNGDVMRPAKAGTYVPLVFQGRKLPAGAAPHTLLVYTATNASSRDGLGIFVAFGRTTANAAQLRTSVQRALGLRGAGVTTGTKKNAAWVSFRTRDTTTAGARAGLKVLGTCLN